MMGAQSFRLGDVLSVTTRTLVSPRGIAGLYGILNFLTALPPDRIELFQRFADAITMLAIHGVLSESESDRGRRRLVKWIAKEAA